MLFDCISEDIPPEVKTLKMVIHIVMHFCSFVSNWSIAIHIVTYHPTICDIINVSNYFPQFIAGYIVAIFLCYSIRCCITKSSALESVFCVFFS